MSVITPREEATQRYWAASNAWRCIRSKGWNVGKLIRELSTLAHFTGRLGDLAAETLQDVIEDKNAPDVSINQTQAS